MEQEKTETFHYIVTSIFEYPSVSDTIPNGMYHGEQADISPALIELAGFPLKQGCFVFFIMHMASSNVTASRYEGLLYSGHIFNSQVSLVFSWHVKFLFYMEPRGKEHLSGLLYACVCELTGN